MDYYLSNTVARYITKLPHVTELDGDWEVALTELSVPAKLITHFFTLSSADSDETRKYTPPPHYHHRLGALHFGNLAAIRAIFSHIFTAHEQKRLLVNFRLTLLHHHSIR